MPKKKVEQTKVTKTKARELREAEQALLKGSQLAKMVADGKKAKGYMVPVNATKAPAGESLPKLEGYTPSDFASRKQYQNAQARVAGYENYDAWIKARKIEGTNDKKNVGRSKIKVRTDVPYKFDFATNKGNLTYTRYENQIRLIQQLLHSAPDNYVVQMFVKGNRYGGGEDLPPEEWNWVQSGLLSVGNGRFAFKNIYNGNFTDFLDSNGITDYTDPETGKKMPGVGEVRIVFHDISKKK